MSDETRTVTVPLEGRGTNDDPFLTVGNGLIATLRYVRLALRFEAFRPIRHTNEFREVEGRVDEALAALAALPVVTAGPEPRKALTFEAMKQVMGATAGYQHTLLPCPHCGKAIELP